LEVINSFRTMTAEDARAARPYVLRTVAMPGSGSFRDLPTATDLADRESQLRVLNQAYPSGSVAAGRLVKTIQ
jgi:predicted Zn-dependent protease